MLDLSLDHLGVKTREEEPQNPDEKLNKRDREVAAGLEEIVSRVGKGKPAFTKSQQTSD